MESTTLSNDSRSTASVARSVSPTTYRSRLRIADLLQNKFDVRSVALTGLLTLSVFYTMYFMRVILLPLVLAVLLSYLLRPIVRALARAKVPLPLGSAAVLLVLIVAIGYGIADLVVPAAGWLEKAPYSLEELRMKLSPLRRPMEGMARASGEIAKFSVPAAGAKEAPAVEVVRPPITELVALRTPEFIGSALLLFVLLYFLLGHDGVFLTKLIKLLPTLSDKKRAVSIAIEVEGQVSRYLFTMTLINMSLGLAVGLAVGLLGLHNPILWGVMVALLNFVPYLGALTGIVCIALAAILSFHSLGYALLLPGVYLVLAILEGNFITPWVMGRSLTLNPVIVLLSLTFWGWLWGIPGVILAVPILAAFKIFCAHVPRMEPFAEFLS